jgi:hypothetical protein
LKIEVLHRVNDLISSVYAKIATGENDRCGINPEPLLDLLSGAIIGGMMFGHGFDNEVG